MREFLKLISWKKFSFEMLIVAVFLILSYLSGNHKFPEKVWIIPVGVILIGISVLSYLYIDYKARKQ